MHDVAPELLELIQNEFEENYNKSKIIADLYQKVRDGTATYLEANEYAIEVGNILSDAYQKFLSSEVLPDGHMYYNIANRIITPTMERNHELIATVATMVQSELNEEAGFGIKTIIPEVNQDRIKGIIEKIVATPKFDDAKWVLGEPVINYSQNVVAETIEANADFHYNSGVVGRIVRKSSGGCCEWCTQLVGTYVYPDVPKDVYRRHDFCRCTVDYKLDGKTTNIHHGNTGKRRYVKDKYGNYVKSKDVRIQHAKEMAATEEKRKEAAREKRINAWERKKLSSSKAEDVTLEYRKKQTPSKGKMAIEPSYNINKHEDEITFANWLHGKFGGDLTLLNESEIDGVMTPDYLWNGKLWELKSTTTEKAANSAIRKGIKQIKENPGGIILNYNTEIDLQKTMEVIDKRMKGSKPEDVSLDIMIVQKNKLLGVFRY